MWLWCGLVRWRGGLELGLLTWLMGGVWIRLGVYMKVFFLFYRGIEGWLWEGEGDIGGKCDVMEGQVEGGEEQGVTRYFEEGTI